MISEHFIEIIIIIIFCNSLHSVCLKKATDTENANKTHSVFHNARVYDIH